MIDIDSQYQLPSHSTYTYILLFSHYKIIFSYGLQNMTFSNNVRACFITYLTIQIFQTLFILYTSFWLQKSKPTLKHINETLSRLSVSEYGSSRSSLNLTRQEKNCKFLIYPNDISARQRNRFIIIYGSQMIYNELMTSLKKGVLSCLCDWLFMSYVHLISLVLS